MAVLKVYDGSQYIPIGGDSTASSTTKDWSHYKNTNTANIVSNATFRESVYVAGMIGGTAIGAGTVFGINSLYCVPMVVTRNYTVKRLILNLVTAGSATSNFQIGIYTNSADNVLLPFNSVSTSGFIPSTGATIEGYNLTETLTANNLYWFVYIHYKSSCNVAQVAVAGAYPIYGVDTSMTGATVPGLGLRMAIPLADSGGLPPSLNSYSGWVHKNTPPAIGAILL